jgi:hypothetical protein
LAHGAKAVNIPTYGLGDLALPPETAQKEFQFESRVADVIDEVTQQAQDLKEPEIPDEAPTSEG